MILCQFNSKVIRFNDAILIFQDGIDSMVRIKAVLENQILGTCCNIAPPLMLKKMEN